MVQKIYFLFLVVFIYSAVSVPNLPHSLMISEPMGVILSYIWANPFSTDDPDPKTGLTSRDRHILTTTWTKLSSGPANLETGMAIFLSLFEKHPQYQKLFPFKDVPREKLKGNDLFRAHCCSLMYAFSAIMGNIDTSAVAVQLLKKHGMNHVSRKVPNDAYEHLKKVLMDLFARSMKEEEIKTWEKFLEVGFLVILEGAHSVQKQ